MISKMFWKLSEVNVYLLFISLEILYCFFTKKKITFSSFLYCFFFFIVFILFLFVFFLFLRFFHFFLISSFPIVLLCLALPCAALSHADYSISLISSIEICDFAQLFSIEFNCQPTNTDNVQSYSVYSLRIHIEYSSYVSYLPLIEAARWNLKIKFVYIQTAPTFRRLRIISSHALTLLGDSNVKRSNTFAATAFVCIAHAITQHCKQWSDTAFIQLSIFTRHSSPWANILTEWSEFCVFVARLRHFCVEN